MASIYKPTGRNKYRIEYKDSTGRTVTVPGFKDKRATEQLARDLERRAEREAAGLPVAAQEMRQAPIADLIQAYADDLARTGRTPKHIDHRTSTVAKIFRELRWPNLTAIRVEPFAQYLRNLNRAPGTQRHYQNSLHGFLQFCCTRGWSEENPIRFLRGTPYRKVRYRRAYTLEEFSRLCKTPNGELYLVAGLSGFRRNELRQMEKRDLDPYGNPPVWAPRAEITKSRRKDIVPILQELLPTIRRIYDSLPTPTSRLFPQVPTVKQMRQDRKKAKIREVDEAGRYADFHSLRYFFCTTLARVLRIQNVQKLMRHADVRMTSAIYMDLGLSDLAEIPSLSISVPTVLPQTLPLPEKPQENRAFSAASC